MAATTLRDIFTSVAASVVTSERIWVGDGGGIRVQTVGSPSTTTVQISQADGRDAAIAEGEWVAFRVLSTETVVDVPQGTRWLRALRSETTKLYVTQQQPIWR